MENKLWKHGPEWIKDPSLWPVWKPCTNTLTTIIEEHEENDKGSEIQRTENFEGVSNIIDLLNYNNLHKLLRISAYVLRFINKCRSRQTYNLRKGCRTREIEQITYSEICKATKFWITDIQGKAFSPEITDIKNKKRKQPMVKQLRLFLDDDELLRCEGRIHNSTLPHSAKFPVLLPKKHKFTDLVIMDTHKCLLHAGVGQVIQKIRQHYWIPSIRPVVNCIVRKCFQCRKTTGRTCSAPDPPPLPKERIDETIPFNTTGVDYAGPMYVKGMNTTDKMYICLFTCANIRAVHLELVPDLSVDTFLLAFRRFTSRYGYPKVIISDNAPTFKRASTVIQQEYNSYVLWKFIPVAAPWYGGFYERMVGITKTVMKKVLGSSLVNADSLRTILTEIEQVINSRPLTYISSNLDEPEPLTPNLLIFGRNICKSLVTPENDNKLPEISQSVCEKVLERQKKLLHDFQQQWRLEYLTSLRERKAVCGKNETKLKEGDVVLTEENTPRVLWTMGRILELLHGKDGLVRTVRLRTSRGSVSVRPVAKLVNLEL